MKTSSLLSGLNIQCGPENETIRANIYYNTLEKIQMVCCTS